MKIVRDFQKRAESVQTKYIARHDAVLKVLFFEIIFDLGLVDNMLPWYLPIKP